MTAATVIVADVPKRIWQFWFATKTTVNFPRPAACIAAPVVPVAVKLVACGASGT